MDCSFCHEAHQRKYRFCTKCGIKLATLFGSELTTPKQQEQEHFCSNVKCKSKVNGMKFCEECGTFVIVNHRLSFLSSTGSSNSSSSSVARVPVGRSISAPGTSQEIRIEEQRKVQYEEALQRRRDALVEHKKAIARIKLSHLSQHGQTKTDPNKRLLLRLSSMDTVARSAFASTV